MRFLCFLTLSLLLTTTSFASEDVDPFMFDDMADYIMDEPAPTAAPVQSITKQDIETNKQIDDILNTPIVENNSILTPKKDTNSFIPPHSNANHDELLESSFLKDNSSNINIDPTQNLTDAFASEPSKDPVADVNVQKIADTWISKIKDGEPLLNTKKAAKNSLEALVEKSKYSKKNANASVFDISGIMLKMSVEQIDRIMQNRGYRKIMQRYEIPNFIKWRNEEKCRNTGVVGYERVESCIVQFAKKDKHQYIQTTKYAKYDSKEEIEVKFTSNFTDNKSYRIIYKSLSAALTGNSTKAVYLRNIKIYDFWKKINQKYGNPDNKAEVKWGLGGNKAYMQASTGFLLLEDPMFRELDFTRMSREDKRYMNTDLYNF